MAIRFPGTAHEYSIYGETFGGLTSPSSSASGQNLFFTSVPLFVAPARYSEVRKVAFWCSLRHEHSGSQGVDELQLKIIPDVTGLGGTDIAPVKNFPSSSKSAYADFTAVAGVNEGSIYGVPSSFNSLVPEQIAASATNGHSCLLFVQFDRFSNDAGSIKFFEDWDAMAAQ
ncbi:MAG: hypothetical protein V3S98_06295, partial [Dehalococcoidia bacterium]